MSQLLVKIFAFCFVNRIKEKQLVNYKVRNMLLNLRNLSVCFQFFENFNKGFYIWTLINFWRERVKKSFHLDDKILNFWRMILSSVFLKQFLNWLPCFNNRFYPLIDIIYFIQIRHLYLDFLQNFGSSKLNCFLTWVLLRPDLDSRLTWLLPLLAQAFVFDEWFLERGFWSRWWLKARDPVKQLISLVKNQHDRLQLN